MSWEQFNKKYYVSACIQGTAGLIYGDSSFEIEDNAIHEASNVLVMDKDNLKVVKNYGFNTMNVNDHLQNELKTLLMQDFNIVEKQTNTLADFQKQNPSLFFNPLGTPQFSKVG